MSRARPFEHNGDTIWFDNKARATAPQLELLADYEAVELDDLLDEGLSQRQVLFRLHQLADPAIIPAHVLERRRERQRLQNASVCCRICTLNDWQCEGRITRHHFVPRWLMLELENYQAYAARTVCTVPICIGRHRDLHFRGESDPPKSIVPYLREHERKFAHRLLDDLSEQHPKIVALMAAGDYHSYEWQLIRDYTQGLFLKEEGYELPEYRFDTGAVATAAT